MAATKQKNKSGEKYYISRFPEGICLNAREYLLEKDGSEMEFDSLRQAYEYIIKMGAKPKHIGYGIFIGTKEKYDMLTYPRVPKIKRRTA